jgi:hypothetical protein
VEYDTVEGRRGAHLPCILCTVLRLSPLQSSLDLVIGGISVEDGTLEGRRGANIPRPICPSMFGNCFIWYLSRTGVEDGAMKGREGAHLHSTPFTVPVLLDLANFAVEGRKGRTQHAQCVELFPWRLFHVVSRGKCVDDSGVKGVGQWAWCDI